MLLILLLFAAFVAHPVEARAQAKSSYRKHRAPACGSWAIARTGTGATPIMEAIFNNWFHGYVSGYNIHGPDRVGDVLGTSSWADHAAFIDDHCRRNPDGSMAEALPALLAKFGRYRAVPADPPIPTAQQGRRAGTITVAATCREWMEVKGDKILRLNLGGAARGYLTAYNRWGPDGAGDVLGAGNDPLVEAWLDEWCSSRPAAPMLSGMAPFIDHLVAARSAGRLAEGNTAAIEQVIEISGE